jgi:hypothetical protein
VGNKYIYIYIDQPVAGLKRGLLKNEKNGAGKKNVGKMWCSKSKNWCLGLVFDNPFCDVKNAFLWC